MAEADIISGDVLLFTGGEGLGPASLRATEALTAKNARLSVIALTEPSPLITAHAGAGGGRVFTLSETTEFSAWLADGGRIRLEHIDYPVLFWRDYGRWLLALTLLPLLLLFQREGHEGAGGSLSGAARPRPYPRRRRGFWPGADGDGAEQPRRAVL